MYSDKSLQIFLKKISPSYPTYSIHSLNRVPKFATMSSFHMIFILFPYFSSIGTTTHCGLWPVEQCPSTISYLPPTLSIFSLPALEDHFLFPLSIFPWVFPFFSSLPVLELRSFWASYTPPFSLGDLTSLSFALFSILF